MQDGAIELPARAGADVLAGLWSRLSDMQTAPGDGPVLCRGAGLTHISAALLQVLLMADASLAARGGLRVVGLGPDTARLLALLGAGHLAAEGAGI